MQRQKLNTNKVKEIFSNYSPRPEGNYRHSAVLAPLLFFNQKAHLLFCKRALCLKNQPADICFPGGKLEQGETALAAAIRETYEEIGVRKDNIEILGQPDYLVLPTNRIVTPFLGLLHHVQPKDFHLNPQEVEKIFIVPLEYFFHTQPKQSYIRYTPNFPEDFPFELIYKGRDYPFANGNLTELFYEYEGNTIWGMTARITYNICEILKRGFFFHETRF